MAANFVKPLNSENDFLNNPRFQRTTMIPADTRINQLEEMPFKGNFILTDFSRLNRDMSTEMRVSQPFLDAVVDTRLLRGEAIVADRGSQLNFVTNQSIRQQDAFPPGRTINPRMDMLIARGYNKKSTHKSTKNRLLK